MLGDVARIAGKAEKVKLAEMPPFRIICKSSEGRLEEGEQFGVEALVFLLSSARFKSDYRYCTLSVFHDGRGVLKAVSMQLRVHHGRSLLQGANSLEVEDVGIERLVIKVQEVIK